MKALMSRIQNRQLILRIVGSLAATILLVYVISRQDWKEIGEALQQIPVYLIFITFAIMLVSRLSVAARWFTLLRSSGMPVTWGDTLKITFAGLFATNFLPTTVGGDVVRLTGAIQLKLDAAVSAASLLVDRLVGMAGMAMAVPFALSPFIQGLQDGTIFTTSAPVVAAEITTLPAASLWKKIWAKGMSVVRRVFTALSLWLKQPRALLVSLLFSWLHMICFFSILYLVFQSMGEPLPFWLIAGLYSIVYFITLVPISINGYGVQELLMMVIFSRLGGVSLTSALSAALVLRTLMMVASLPGAAFVPGIVVGHKEQQKSA